MIVSRDLLEAAVALRGASPALWERFLIGMRAYAAAQAAEMVKCEPAMLMRAQGMLDAFATECPDYVPQRQPDTISFPAEIEVIQIARGDDTYALQGQEDTITFPAEAETLEITRKVA